MIPVERELVGDLRIARAGAAASTVALLAAALVGDVAVVVFAGGAALAALRWALVVRRRLTTVRQIRAAVAATADRPTIVIRSGHRQTHPID